MIKLIVITLLLVKINSEFYEIPIHRLRSENEANARSIMYKTLNDLGERAEEFSISKD
jgi:hypothetical protein